MGRIDIDAIRRATPLPSIVAASVKLTRAGNEYKGCCPFHEDRSPSFTLYQKDARWRWQCFDGCGGGDEIDFVRRLHGVDWREAAERLAGGNLPSVHVAPIPAAESRADRGDEARTIWREGVAATGTPAETYLRSRGLHLPIPASIRFTRLKYGKSGPQYPALAACVASVDNRLAGIQRTYLNAAGTGKAEVPKPKLSLGRVAGGAIRLAPAARELIVCEGLEDGLTLMQTLGLAVWVAAGASMLPLMQFPVGVQSVAIGGDNDAAGRTAARNAAEVFAARGLNVRCFFPLEGFKDFNAELQGVEA